MKNLKVESYKRETEMKILNGFNSFSVEVIVAGRREQEKLRT